MAVWKKGQSGNPGGRPKELKEIVKLARSYGPEAIKRLAYWVRSKNARASVAAAQALLDRGYGKPSQPIEASGPDGQALNIQVVFRKPEEKP